MTLGNIIGPRSDSSGLDRVVRDKEHEPGPYLFLPHTVSEGQDSFKVARDLAEAGHVALSNHGPSLSTGDSLIDEGIRILKVGNGRYLVERGPNSVQLIYGAQHDVLIGEFSFSRDQL